MAVIEGNGGLKLATNPPGAACGTPHTNPNSLFYGVFRPCRLLLAQSPGGRLTTLAGVIDTPAEAYFPMTRAISRTLQE